MNNKVLVELVVPELDFQYDVFLPVNRKIGNIIHLLNQAVSEMTDGLYQENDQIFLYNAFTGQKYEVNQILKDTDIRNGSRLILY